jgi:hypothetical protein
MTNYKINPARQKVLVFNFEKSSDDDLRTGWMYPLNHSNSAWLIEEVILIAFAIIFKASLEEFMIHS